MGASSDVDTPPGVVSPAVHHSADRNVDRVYVAGHVVELRLDVLHTRTQAPVVGHDGGCEDAAKRCDAGERDSASLKSQHASHGTVEGCARLGVQLRSLGAHGRRQAGQGALWGWVSRVLPPPERAIGPLAHAVSP